jgi:LPXTG-site transpeptidase (sortase) family protein
MRTKQTRWGKYPKVYARVSIFILGILLFLGLILVPIVVSSAQLNEPQYMPLVLKDLHLGPADTSTLSPSATITETITPTITPTITSTIGPASTSTTGPSPTFTGTLTPNASITISVSPSTAKVNEIFTFTITVKNTGTRPTLNNVVFDSFSVSYIDVTDVATSKGTYIKQSRSFIVTIGNVYPGEIVTITTKVKVNSSLTVTTTNSNLVTLTYDDGASKTASVAYKAVFQTLPGTGELPLNWRQNTIKPLGLIPGIVLMGLGGIALLMAVGWAKARNPKYKLWMTVGGALLIFIGFAISVTASGLINPIRPAQVYQLTPTSGVLIAQGQPEEPSATTLAHLPASAFSTPDSVVPIVTLPDYPIPTPVITVTPQPGVVGPDTSVVTRIVIPALLLDTEVKYVPYDGVSWLITGLRQEVAWMGNTSWPGLGGNTGLAGHITVAGMGDGPFRHLDELPKGELVLLYTEKNIYTYQVRESKVTDDGDMSVTAPTDNPQISLITCINWDQESRTYLNRLVVIADLINTEPITIGRVP